MKTKRIFSTLAILSVVLFAACKKDNSAPTPSGTTTTTIPSQTIVQNPVSLGTAASTLAVLAGSAITNTGATTVTGDMGLSPGTSIGGFPTPGTLVGTQHINDATAIQAQADLTAAYNDAAGRTSTDMVLLAGNLGGLTLTPGLYKSTSTLSISSGNLTFDAKGNSNAIFIIQIASTLNTSPGRQVFLTNGALASNIFWQVGTSATFGTTTVFKGTIMANAAISFATGATLDGKALARSGAVTMDANTIVKQ